MTTTIEDAIDQELEQAHVRLILDISVSGSAQDVYILTSNPPTDDPE